MWIQAYVGVGNMRTFIQGPEGLKGPFVEGTIFAFK